MLYFPILCKWSVSFILRFDFSSLRKRILKMSNWAEYHFSFHSSNAYWPTSIISLQSCQLNENNIYSFSSTASPNSLNFPSLNLTLDSVLDSQYTKFGEFFLNWDLASSFHRILGVSFDSIPYFRWGLNKMKETLFLGGKMDNFYAIFAISFQIFKLWKNLHNW